MTGIGRNGRFHVPEESGGGDDPRKDFPMRDEYRDCAGKKRVFELTYREVSLGYRVMAEEDGKDGLGYEFSAFDASSPYLALGAVREKIYRALATKHVEIEGHPHHVPTHDVIRGRITARDGEALLVIDGEPLSLAEFGLLLEANEGREFELLLLDAC